MNTQEKTWKSIRIQNEIARALDDFQFDIGQYVVDSTSDGFTVRDTRNPEESQETVHFEVTKILSKTWQLRVTTRDAPLDVKYEVDTDTVDSAVDRIRGILDGLFLQQQANRF